MAAPSTTDIFGRRAMGHIGAADYVDWAEGMLLAGHDTRYLRMLAGLDRQANVFEAEDAFVRAVRELGLTEPADPVLAYACDLARRLTAGELEAKLAVRALFRVWVASDAAPEYAIWLALDDALDALEAGDPPYAYPGATLDTFDDIARREARAFLDVHRLPP